MKVFKSEQCDLCQSGPLEDAKSCSGAEVCSQPYRCSMLYTLLMNDPQRPKVMHIHVLTLADVKALNTRSA